MTRHVLCLAVVPAYNEADTIAEVVASLRRCAPDFDTLVVDDGSTDATAILASEAGAQVLRLPFNVGIGGAVQTGFVYERLLGAMEQENVDVVCGSRFLTADYRYPAPLSRRTGIHIFAFLLSRIVGMPVSDPTSGFRLYNRRAIELFARDYPHDYPEVEAVLILHRHRLRMREIPVRMYSRGGGASSINTGKSAYYMVKVLLALFVGLGRRPAFALAEPEPIGVEEAVG
jgi:glycosyltransferase involved in cell wall biosynthesis